VDLNSEKLYVGYDVGVTVGRFVCPILEGDVVGTWVGVFDGFMVGVAVGCRVGR